MNFYCAERKIKMPTGYIYEITSNDKNITEYYIGSTWDVGKRIREHASNCCNENSKDYILEKE